MLIRTIGACAIFAAAVILRGELCKERRRSLLVTEELYRFISHIRLQIGCFLRPQAELGIGFSSDLFSEVGFLSSLGDSGSLSEAFEATMEREKMQDDAKRIISELFSSLGGGYAEDEIKLIDSALDELQKILERERKAVVRDTKLIGTLSASLALGIIIFLI